MAPTNLTLLRYDSPVVVQTKDRPEQVPDMAEAQAADVLHAILPPRAWEQGGVRYLQRAASTPATRLEVVALQERLDRALQERQAHETGICAIREELYCQCFDEVIRQVTVGCAERGLLLLRLRDEMRMTLAAYQALYESSLAFGLRKVLQAEEGKDELAARGSAAEAQAAELRKQVAEARLQAPVSEQRHAERAAAEAAKHASEVAFLENQVQQLHQQLEAFLAYGSSHGGPGSALSGSAARG